MGRITSGGDYYYYYRRRSCSIGYKRIGKRHAATWRRRRQRYRTARKAGPTEYPGLYRRGFPAIYRVSGTSRSGYYTNYYVISSRPSRAGAGTG
jgi:hypothetical protein